MRNRVYHLFIFILFLSVGMIVRLVQLQIFRCEYYRAEAAGQQQRQKMILPQRGEIFLRDISLSRREGEEQYFPLAVNKEFQEVYVVPKDVLNEKKEELADRLSEILEIDRDLIVEKVNKEDDPYEPIKRKVDKEDVEEIANLDIEGIGFSSETFRSYPQNDLASQLVGFVGGEGKGQYGLEEYYENELKGNIGMEIGGWGIGGYDIPFLSNFFKPAEDGTDLVLTVDQNIQFQAEKELGQVLEKWQAEKGSIIIMDPRTGAILAMANSPSFDPNKYNEVSDIDFFRNPSIQEMYEPGSIFKPITMAIGLDSNSISSQETYIDTGQVVLGGGIIKNSDSKSYGEQTMAQILEKSLNTGVVYVQRKTGQDTFREYIQKFGFDRPTGIDLAGETGGSINNVFSRYDIDLATMSFGQGVNVTPLGLLAAISSIANEGKMMKPYVVHKKIYADGSEEITKPEVVNQMISSESALELTRMMVGVVDNGQASLARVPGYSVAGKTGTAQMPDFESGGYSEDDTIHSFVGFAPAFDPAFAILIKIEKPIGVRFAASSVSSVFGNLAKYILNYLEIPAQ